MDFMSFLFFILLLVFFVGPTFRKKMLEIKRIKAIRELERKRGSRVITLIHRQEALGILGIPFYRYIDIEDSEKILRAIRLTPHDMPIDLILHTPGGLVLASEQIAHALLRHKAKVTVFVPHYAMSGGMLIALAADEIILDEDAVLGSLDPQLGWQYPASSLIWTAQAKDRNELDDRTLIYLDVAQKAVRQLRQLIFDILQHKVEKDRAWDIANLLTEGRWTHDFPLTVEKLKSLGIEVKVEMPREVYNLMELYPQVGLRRPSVEYIPLPYEKKVEEKK
ncbi:MAG: ATP-dependent Clp protease proteolytic subunit [Actinomycetota bacterium]|nr:ATP-dependent Clp protease proteolytic subunit [Actinomycetota bacterium]